MADISRKTGRASAVEIEIPYDVTGAADLRNTSHRSLFQPLEAVVTFHDGRAYSVRIKGRRYNQYRTWTDTYFRVEDGQAQPGDRNPVVPQFVHDLIEDASRHPAVLACAATV